MQVFIISIEDEESPRLNKFLAQPFFQNKKLPFNKIGIKGGEISAKIYFEQAVKGRNKPLTPAELGCSLSHLEALKSFLATNDNYALIFEDDAIIPKNLTIKVLEEEFLKSQFPSNLLFSLGGIQMKECLNVRGKIQNFKFLSQSVLKVVPDFYHRVNYAVAYIVDRDMATTLIGYHQPMRKADDWSYLFDFNSKSNILMTHLIDHPEIELVEKDLQISAIEAERFIAEDIPQSQYGVGLRKNLAKLSSNKYPK